MSKPNGLAFEVSEAVALREELYKVQEAVRALASRMHPVLEAQILRPQTESQTAEERAWEQVAVLEARQEMAFAAARTEMRQHLERTVGMMMSPRSWE